MRILVLVVLCTAVVPLARAAPPSIGTSCSSTYYGGYEPTPVSAEAGLPEAMARSARRLIEGRLGAGFPYPVEFAGGVAIDLEELYRQNPGARDYKWTVPAYDLNDRFGAPRAGIEEYCFRVELDPSGHLVNELELPDAQTHPWKARLLDFDGITAVAAQHGFEGRSAQFSYDKKRDAFVWTFRVRESDDGVAIRFRTLKIESHTGAVAEFGKAEALR
jgi:hypothetical protein